MAPNLLGKPEIWFVVSSDSVPDVLEAAAVGNWDSKSEAKAVHNNESADEDERDEATCKGLSLGVYLSPDVLIGLAPCYCCRLDDRKDDFWKLIFLLGGGIYREGARVKKEAQIHFDHARKLFEKRYDPEYLNSIDRGKDTLPACCISELKSWLTRNKSRCPNTNNASPAPKILCTITLGSTCICRKTSMLHWILRQEITDNERRAILTSNLHLVIVPSDCE
jgi:hypothetical protein